MESAETPQPRPPPDRAAATCHNAALVMTANMSSWSYWPDLGVHRGTALRIDGVRYERRLERIESGAILDGITRAIRDKYSYQISSATVESRATWMFEAAPR